MKTIITLALALSVSTVIAQSNTAQRTAANHTNLPALNSNPVPANDAQPQNPLYSADGGATVNPLAENSAKTTGQPIGGIVVKGGHNGLAGDAKVDGSPIGGIVVKGGHNGFAGDAKTDGSPIGGIVVKGGRNGLAGDAKVTGQPIGGIVVKGGQNPTHFTTGNPIPGVGVVVKHNIADRQMAFNYDELLNDVALLSYLNVDQITIKQGNYVISPDGEVTLAIEKIVHKDIAARNILLNGYDAPTKTSFTYTVEPVFVDGQADHIIITFKGISEKGVK